jgi:uncharacterized protein YjiS (DUF1127 family)
MTFNELATKYRHWKSIRLTIRELSRLDDRELDDLGIGRGRIAEIARRAYG